MNSKIWKNIRGYKWGSMYINYLNQLLLLLSVPFLIFFCSIYFIYNNMFETEMINTNTVSLLHFSNTIDMTLQNIMTQTNWFIFDPNVVYFMTSKDNQLLYDASRITSTLDLLSTTTPFVKNIYIYSEMSDNVISIQSGGNIQNFFDSTWYESYLANQNKMYWIERRIKSNLLSEKSEYIISIYRVVSYSGDNKGVIVINLDTYEINRFLESGKDLTNNEFTIYNSDGKLLYSYGLKNNTDLVNINELDESITYSKVSGKKRNRNIDTSLKSKDTGLIYISSMLLIEHSEKMKYLYNFIILIMGCTILICVLLAFYLSYRIFKPVIRILLAIDSGGIYSDDVNNVQQHRNEVAFIIDTISKNIEDKKTYEIEIENRMKLLRRAQMVAMQSQINPHFLFNILATIRYMAMELTSGNNQVSDALSSLASLFQFGLEGGEQFTTVAKEMEHVKRYMELQKIRYGSKFEYEIKLQHEVLNMQTVKIILQPIVENAIQHGINPQEGRCKIIIEGKLEEDILMLSVTDDGVGMETEEIEKLNHNMGTEYFENFKNIGIKNVNQRLKLIFGDRYGLLVCSKKGEGTQVYISQPKD